MFASFVWLIPCALFLATLAAPAPGQEKPEPVYELRTYHASPGKLEDLHRRFREHTVRLFEKHGMLNLAYWVPRENPDHRLIYVLRHASREAREQSWKAFGADPEWQRAFRESEANGPLVARIEVALMRPTDYSPPIRASVQPGRVFELRTYTASPGNLDRLNARFRNHTLRLFEKHGMTNVAYWTLLPDQNGAGVTLIYLLAHRSVEAARASFDAFRQDPAWIAARQTSEQEAGGSLTAAGGVKSVFLDPTPYSPTR